MHLKIAFYKCNREEEAEALINRLVTFFSGKFVHAELVFEDNFSCSIYQNETVFFRKKTFGRNSWVFKKIKANATQIAKARAYCEKQAKLQKPFNKTGLIRCLTPFPRKTDETCFFCTELILCALQKAGLCHSLDSSMTSPNDLFVFLNEQNKCINASAVMDARLQKTKLNIAGTSSKTSKTLKTSKKLKKKKTRFKLLKNANGLQR